MKTNDYFQVYMQLVLDDEVGAKATVDEHFANEQLLTASQCSMSLRLHHARDGEHHGWWNKEVRSLAHLYALREEALAEHDHVGVLNLTAMIAMRESMQSE